MSIKHAVALSVLAVALAGIGLVGINGGQQSADGVNGTAVATDANPSIEGYKQARMAAAMRGMSFDTGRVVLDEAVAAAYAGILGNDAAAEARRAEAHEAMMSNERSRAIRLYKEAAFITPDDPANFHGLGEAFRMKGKLNEALAAYRTALDLDAELPATLFMVGLVQSMQSKWDEAQVSFEQVIALDATYPEVYARLAAINYYAGNLDDAEMWVAEADRTDYPAPAQLKAILDGTIERAEVRLAPLPGDPVVEGQTRVDVAGGTAAANETSIAMTEGNPDRIVGSWNDWRDSGGSETIRVGVAVSDDAGETWSDFTVRPPAPNRSNVEGDPMTAYDNRTGTLWVGGISFAGNGGMYLARWGADDLGFQPSVMARATGGADKGWMAAGPQVINPNGTSLYMAYNQGLIGSNDMGDTWTSPASLGSGLGFLPRVGANGQVYVSYWTGGTALQMKRTFTGSAPFTTHTMATRMDVWGSQDGSRFPGRFRVPMLPTLAVNPVSGTLYTIWFDTTEIVGGNRNVDLYFQKSTNQGTTWTTPVILNTDGFPPGDQFWPWLEVDQRGELHVVFHDSRNTAQNDDVVHGMFDAYYAHSDDDGATWTEYRLTPNSFDSDDDGLNRSTQFLGDYNGLALAGRTVFPLYLSTQNGDSDSFVNRIRLPGSGDYDNNGALDLSDFARMQACFSGTTTPISVACDEGDINADNRLNIDDYDEFADMLTGPQ
jgi:Tfp pilus assembly protein PilF